MAGVGTYLNFADSTEEVFAFYKSVFGTEYSAPIQRFKDLPVAPGMPPVPPEVENLVLHVELPLLGGHILHGSDAPHEFGFKVTHGNGVNILLEPDSRAEAERLFAALSEGGVVEMPLQDMFWGSYFGNFTDRYGIRWMLSVARKA